MHALSRSVLAALVASTLFAFATSARAEKSKTADHDEEAPKAEHARDETTTTDATTPEGGIRMDHAIGLRARYLYIPKAMIDLFADGGASVSGYDVGVEYASERKGFQTIAALSFANYQMPSAPFKGSSDPDQGWELVDVNLNVVYASVDFLWEHDLSPQWSILYGGTAGLGYTFGTFHRHQLTPADGKTPGDPHTYVRCPANAAGTAPLTVTPYCANDNDHYGRDEKTWFSGGSKPVVMPLVALQTGAQFNANDKLSFRLDLGWGITGFFAGIGGNYGI